MPPDALERGRGARATRASGDKFADLDWRSFAESLPQPGSGVRPDDDRPLPRGDPHAPPVACAEHLEWQLQLARRSSADERSAAQLDRRQPRRARLPARDRRGDRARRRRARGGGRDGRSRKVQTLDPPGVAARDLRECLLLQLDALRIDHPLVRALVADHLDLLQKRDFRELARAARVDASRRWRGRRDVDRPARARGRAAPSAATTRSTSCPTSTSTRSATSSTSC